MNLDTHTIEPASVSSANVVEAARALERARAIGVPASLALDVEGRLALAYLETGDPRGPDLARAYVEAHPEAVRAADLRARLDR